MSEDNIHGRFLWYELLATDPDAAKAFYPALLGWGTTEWEGGSQPYTLFTRGEAPIAGMLRIPDEAQAQGAHPHWLPYIGAPDLEATVSRAQELGATPMVPPTDIPTVGRFAVLRDPQGALFAAYTPATPPQAPESDPQLGEFSWHELATTDGEAAFAFYSDLFGWEKISAFDMGPAGVYQMYGHGGRTLGGIYTQQAEGPSGPPSWLGYVLVDDVHRRGERAKELGGQVVSGPMEVPGGDWIVVCLDPQGSAFALHRKAQAG